jgi:nucleotide-binding universal stress UspA family protein
MKHILSPTDGSEHALRAVTLAAQLARGMNCKLSILAVTQYIIGRSEAFDMWTPDEAAKFMAEAKKIARAEGVQQVDCVELRARDVSHAILEFAESHEVDHIVIGSAGRTGVAKFLLGSTSSEVLRKSFCAVTIVH